ncbi:hypothetical protein BJ912DRAFT_969227 [Pholiota molesta]|nr:hypothetical protein BJ912DRAFT_969227 [Pholiota molesta]
MGVGLYARGPSIIFSYWKRRQRRWATAGWDSGYAESFRAGGLGVGASAGGMGDYGSSYRRRRRLWGCQVGELGWFCAIRAVGAAGAQRSAVSWYLLFQPPTTLRADSHVRRAVVVRRPQSNTQVSDVILFGARCRTRIAFRPLVSRKIIL